MSAKRVSLKTVAETAGVSVPTVSQILNRRSGNYSSQATRQKVLEAARKLNYRPSFAYRLMQGKETNTAAILDSDHDIFKAEFPKTLFIELAICFEKRKWSVYTGGFSRSVERNLELISEMHQRGVEKVVLVGTPVGWREIVAKLEEYAIPYVGTAAGIYSRTVQNGSRLGVERIIRRLKETAGRHLKLVVPANAETRPENLSRFRALCAAYPELPQADLLSMIVMPPPIPPDCPDYPEAARTVGYETAKKILTEEPETRAIVFINDDTALGGAYYLMEHPELRPKVRLAGYNNNTGLADFPVPITTGGTPSGLWAEELVNSIADEGRFEKTVYPVLRFREEDPSKKTYPFWREEVVQVTP